MGVFHASGGRGRLASSLGSKLFLGSLSSSGFAISLLNTSHLFWCDIVGRASPIGFEVFISSPFIVKVLLKWEINGISACDCLH